MEQQNIHVSGLVINITTVMLIQRENLKVTHNHAI